MSLLKTRSAEKDCPSEEIACWRKRYELHHVFMKVIAYSNGEQPPHTDWDWAVPVRAPLGAVEIDLLAQLMSHATDDDQEWLATARQAIADGYIVYYASCP